jgi:hypothetical protein
LLFQLISRLDEKTLRIIARNLSLGEWGRVSLAADDHHTAQTHHPPLRHSRNGSGSLRFK